MAYREWRPAGLPDGVACVWVNVVEGGPGRVLPDACVDLVWRPGGGVHLAGPDTTAVVTDIMSGTVIVGARFAPGAGGPALGLALDGVRDAQVPMADIRAIAAATPGDREVRDVVQDLRPDAALRRLAALAARLVAAAPPDPAVREAARRLSDPRTRVDALAADLGLSDRQLRRRCLAAAGHPPKVLQRILRFQSFVAALDAEPDADLARLAAEHGYADQAHLTGECTALAGLPPAALRRDRAAAARERHEGVAPMKRR